MDWLPMGKGCIEPLFVSRRITCEEFHLRRQHILERLRQTAKDLDDAKKKCEGLCGEELDAAMTTVKAASEAHDKCLLDKAYFDLMTAPIDISFMSTDVSRPRPIDNTAGDWRDEQRRQEAFIDEYNDEIERFGLLNGDDNSRKFLLGKPHLACDYSKNYLLAWSLHLELAGYIDRFENVARQYFCLNAILELRKKQDDDIGSCIEAFYNRLRDADEVETKTFLDELEVLKTRLRSRARLKYQKARLAQKAKYQRFCDLGPMDWFFTAEPSH